MLNSWFVVCLQLQSTVVFLPRLCAGYTGMEEFRLKMKKCVVGEASAVGRSTSEGLLYKLNPSLDSCNNLILARGAKMQAEGLIYGKSHSGGKNMLKKHSLMSFLSVPG